MLSRKTCGTRNKLCSGTWNNIVNKVQTLFQRDLVNKTRTEQSLKNWNKDDSGQYTGCFKSPVRRLNFERIYVEYYNRYRAKTKCNRFAIAKSAIDFNFTIVSIVILKIYTFKVQTGILTFGTPCI